MYLKRYRLRESPFGVTPDPAFLYLSPSHREALASIIYGVENRKGFIVLSGEVGCGKTTILRAVLNEADPENLKFLYIFDPELTFTELISVLFEELALGTPPDSTAVAVRQLSQYLIETYRSGARVALFIDEAQRVPLETLERLRILSNLETDKEKLLQIVLCGQPELEEILARHDLRQLRQRVAVKTKILPLTFNESVEYIKHRLRHVCYGRDPVFTPEALKRIARYGKGNPRVINLLAEHALVAGYADGKKPVTLSVVKESAADLLPKARISLNKWASAGVLSIILLCSVLTVLAIGDGNISSGNDTIDWAQEYAMLPEALEADSKEEQYPGPATNRQTLQIVPAHPSSLTTGLQRDMAGPTPETHEYILDSPTENQGATAIPEEAELSGMPELGLSPKSSAREIEGIPPNATVSDTRIQPYSAYSPRKTTQEFSGHHAEISLADSFLIETSKHTQALEASTETKIEETKRRNISKQGPPVVLRVASGDTLYSLLRRVYGRAHPDIVDLVLNCNPDLKDADWLTVGAEIRFPSLENDSTGQARKTGTAGAGMEDKRKDDAKDI